MKETIVNALISAFIGAIAAAITTFIFEPYKNDRKKVTDITIRFLIALLTYSPFIFMIIKNFDPGSKADKPYVLSTCIYFFILALALLFNFFYWRIDRLKDEVKNLKSIVESDNKNFRESKKK